MKSILITKITVIIIALTSVYFLNPTKVLGNIIPKIKI